MPTSDILEIQLKHDRWATQLILEACAKLSPEQFHQRFEMGPGSLHDTLTHMMAAMRTWTQTLAGVDIGPRIDADKVKRTPAELLAILETFSDEFAAEAHRRPLAELASRTREGKRFQFTRAAILTHVITHGMHHRAQCLNMLRQLGVKPLPPSSVAEWTRFGDVSD